MEKEYITVAVIKGEPVYLSCIRGTETFLRAKSVADTYFESWKEITCVKIFELYSPFKVAYELKREEE